MLSSFKFVLQANDAANWIAAWDTAPPFVRRPEASARRFDKILTKQSRIRVTAGLQAEIRIGIRDEHPTAG